MFGPQKGADRAMVERLEASLAAAAAAAPGLAGAPGAGAGGGLGFALLGLGASRVAGAELVCAAVRLAARMERADVVVTGEGSFDASSLRGKVTAAVATLAQERALPCLVLAGRVFVGRREAAAHGFAGCYSLTEQAGEEQAMGSAALQLTRLAARVGRQWSRAAPGLA
jgi:glycerate kinase